MSLGSCHKTVFPGWICRAFRLIADAVELTERMEQRHQSYRGGRRTECQGTADGLSAGHRLLLVVDSRLRRSCAPEWQQHIVACANSVTESGISKIQSRCNWLLLMAW